MSGPIAQQITLGELSITALILGEIYDRVEDWFAADQLSDFRSISRLPVICLHISGPGLSILIDACDPRQYPINGVEPLDIQTSLRKIGIHPEDITRVILTHGHHDHFCGVWDLDREAANFPNARHILSAQDWGNGTLTATAQMADGSAANPGPLEKLWQMGLLDLDTCDPPLPPGVSLIDAAGETKGHRVVRISSNGQAFYFLADLFHVPAELNAPDLCPIWADAPALKQSRRLLTQAIIQANAQFMCSHLPEVFSADRFNFPSFLGEP
ncbi:MBL fold metallo-hydrolase [Pseudophaeobacter sp.]|uniref:MBL fold metallo-hydrolase n=1 Tax=Pseudophaeobacter sp. TaxID=1971739 RepID=UPI003297FBDA